MVLGTSLFNIYENPIIYTSLLFDQQCKENPDVLAYNFPCERFD